MSFRLNVFFVVPILMKELTELGPTSLAPHVVGAPAEARFVDAKESEPTPVRSGHANAAAEPIHNAPTTTMPWSHSESPTYNHSINQISTETVEPQVIFCYVNLSFYGSIWRFKQVQSDRTAFYLGGGAYCLCSFICQILRKIRA